MIGVLGFSMLRMSIPGTRPSKNQPWYGYHPKPLATFVECRTSVDPIRPRSPCESLHGLSKR